MSDPEFLALQEQVLAGDQEAIRRLVEEYGGVLRHAVRDCLPPHLRPRFDSLDFAQDVWASFFTDLPAGRTFEAPDELRAFLTRVARHKVIEAVRQQMHGAHQNILREEPMNGADAAARLAARQATPSTVAMSREEWERLLKSQPPVYRRLLILVRNGTTPTEAARELGVSGRAARRLIAKYLPGLTP